MNEGKDIFNIKEMAETLRYTEYKDIASAASEIVDNSVEAKSKNVIIIADSTTGRKGNKIINDIAFLDDGTGMDYEQIFSCLVFGEGDRKRRKGIGRFGVGLAQSSLFASPRVEVYSWQKYEDPLFVYLDTIMMRKGEQEKILPPVVEGIPEKYKKYITNEFKKSGTLVVWRGVDNCNVKQVQTLFNRFDEALGKTYRYFLDSGEVRIRLEENEVWTTPRYIKAKDPMFLLENDSFLGSKVHLGSKAIRKEDSEPIFEPYISDETPGGEIKIKYEYFKDHIIPSESYITLKFSIVKSKFYREAADNLGKANPGDTHIGKYIKKYEGISVVRARREVDFGRFQFYDSINKPNNRWWGCEILFEPELDEVFRVSSNKQHVELKRPTKDEQSHYSGELNVWEVLEPYISKMISKMYKINNERQSGARKGKSSKNLTSLKPSEHAINIVESSKKDIIPNSFTKRHKEEDEKVLKEYVNELLDIDASDDFIDFVKTNQVNIEYKAMDNDHDFIKFKYNHGICFCMINTNHKFYMNVLNKISDSVAKASVEVLLGTLAKVGDEMLISRQGLMWFKKFENDINIKISEYIERI